MKILYIATRSELFSGGQISLLELVSRLDRTRFDPVVLCPGEGGFSEKLRQMGIQVRIWDMPTARTINIFKTSEKIRELRSIIKDLAAEIVHTNGSRGQFYASRAVKGTGARLVWHVRESKKDLPLYDLFLAKASDKIICVSRSVKDKRFGCYPCVRPKINVVYNGVDISDFFKDDREKEAERKRSGIGSDKTLLGVVGLLVPRKGHLFLFKALKAVIKKHPETMLVVVGKTVDPVYAEDLRREARSLGIENNVLFMGPRENIRPILSMLDIFILPSKREGFSRILLEAMACSAPIIATDVSGNNEAVAHNETGLLVPYGDVTRLAVAIERMIADRAEAKMMGLNARKRVEDLYTIEAHVLRVQDLYFEVVGTRRCFSVCCMLKDLSAKVKKYLSWKIRSALSKPDKDSALAVPKQLQPLYHSWAGYHGPWIENYFYNFWCANKKKISKEKIGRIYVPVFWTDYYLKHSRREPNKEIQRFIDENIKPDKKYFTVVQNADGIIEKLPGNVLVFAAGGVGDIPIPLIKGRLRQKKRTERDIKVSFMGVISREVRLKMYDVLKDREGYYFGGGSMKEFADITTRSVFALCPRGYGRTSYRLYEAMALGSIPVYIWDDVEWLPYKDDLNWGEFSISINITDIEKLPEIIEGHTPEMIKQKQEKIKKLYKEYFTMPGTCKQVVRILKGRG